MEFEDEYYCTASNGQSINKYDIKFFNFYYEAIRKLIDIENIINASHLTRYFNIFYKYFYWFCEERPQIEPDDDYFAFINLLKDTLHYRVAYVFKCSAFLSSAVAFHFRNYLKATPDYLQRLLKKQTIKICSLGGGPTSDIVAIVTVLESLAQKDGILLDFQITVIDFDMRWKNTCITVLSCLGQFKNATWKINLIEEDLSKWKCYSSKTTDAIQEADIVTMVMLLSDMKVTISMREETIQHISTILRTQAMLFVLDKSWINIIKSCGGCSGEIYGLQMVYEELCDFHALDINAVRTCFLRYRKRLGNFNTMSSWNIFARIWFKDPSSPNENSTNELQQRFQINIEKYNPKQDSLNVSLLKRWESIFSKQKNEDGWHQKGIANVVQQYNEMRGQFLARLMKEIKLLNASRDFLNVITIFNGTENEFNEKAWVEYWKQKQELSLLKREIYSFSKLLLLKIRK